MKYYIVDAANKDAERAAFLYLDYPVKEGEIFETYNNHILGTGKYTVKKVVIIDEKTAECICEKAGKD